MLTARATIDGTAKGGLITFQVLPEDRHAAKRWLIHERGKTRTHELIVKLFRKGRTIEQNALYWALLSILAYETYEENGWEEHIHEEILTLYAPRIEGRILKKHLPKRSKHMNTVEFSRIIEGVFRELAMCGVHVTESMDIERYWREWMNWRGKQGVDPLSKSYHGIQDYMDRQVFCEACLKYTGPERGALPHIVSKGAGGSDDVWNRLRLCDECHKAQHRNGWDMLIKKHPHIGWRVLQARERAGAPPLEKPERQPDLITEGREDETETSEDAEGSVGASPEPSPGGEQTDSAVPEGSGGQRELQHEEEMDIF